MTDRYPFGYGQQYKTLAELKALLDPHYHPEYIRRLLAWLESKGGKIGVGGMWRADGTQPDKPGFAPEGKSFHQNQRYADGFIGACAVDLVAPDGPDADHNHDGVRWADVPAQGSAEAARWGVHCNISTEAWHMQPIEIDGWDTWRKAGSPAPRAGYPLPTDPVTPPPPEVLPIPPVEDDMRIFVRNAEKHTLADDGKTYEPNTIVWEITPEGRLRWVRGAEFSRLVSAAGLTDWAKFPYQAPLSNAEVAELRAAAPAFDLALNGPVTLTGRAS